MRKTLFTFLFVCLSLLLMTGSAFAVAGQCSNCHTMHDSQDGSEDEGDAGAQDQLLLASCAGCHTSAGTGQLSAAPINGPVVYHSGGTTGNATGNGASNAGGDFYFVIADETTGHNVADIAALGTDSTITPANTPPGWDFNATKNAVTGYAYSQITGGDNANWGANQLTCAGTYGCHGNHSVASSLQAISGAHHNNVDTTGGGQITATSADTASITTHPIGGSYRFLNGIKGLEDADWNWNETTNTHNEYYGDDDNVDERDDDATDTYNNLDTMSFFCAECHGKFHQKILQSGGTWGTDPWVRHPTDIVIPDANEYAEYNSDNGTGGDQSTYNVQVPVARPVVPTNAQGSQTNVDPGDSTTRFGAIVMCLSCHRAHASEFPDALRWDYTLTTVGKTGAGSVDGCFVCHVGKNGINVGSP